MFREKPLLIILLLFPTVLYDAPLYAQDEKSSSWTASLTLSAVTSGVARGRAMVPIFSQWLNIQPDRLQGVYGVHSIFRIQRG
jgi:hypothetical protein